MFLTEHLASAEPEVIARHALPTGARLHAADVAIPRDDLPRRWNVDTKIRVPCLVIPAPPNAKGLRDSWVVILPLSHTFFATSTEDLDEVIASEVKRLVACRELSPSEYLDLLPAHRRRRAVLMNADRFGHEGTPLLSSRTPRSGQPGPELRACRVPARAPRRLAGTT